MKTIELFSGTKSFSKVAKELGHTTHTVDNDCSLEPDECVDMFKFIPNIYCPHDFKYDILWASPPCTAFSVASICTHWGGGHRAYVPKTENAQIGINLVKTTLKIIKEIKPKYFFIENPRGVLRKLGLLDHLIRHTVTYCQYGDERMKPTDIWTNAEWWKPKPMCKNGDPCHVRAPRGSKTGTQGLKSAKERGVIPPELFYELFKQYEHS